ncbi:hypothetical protein EOD10_20360 [Mesorhizobium sp. M7A.T.Ca.TU.009.01.3.2]|nr:hypothetical protein EOD10_20360 [Mesorhizobium sp. M7A.T.Ca.TU.009.01.3.2]
MADDVTLPGTGDTVAADDIGGVKFQRAKLSLGADGSATDALGGAGAVAAGVQRVTLASDDPAVALLTILGGYLDGVETLIGSSNTKLDTLHADLATTLAGLVDGLEGILGTTSGVAVITDANGTVQQYLRGLVKQWIAGTLVIGAGTNLIGKIKTPFFTAASGQLVRPANQTPYSIGDEVSASSPASLSVTVADVNDNPVTLERIRVSSNDTGFGGKAIRVWVYNGATTAGTDNAAFATAKANFIGSFSGTLRAASDGCVGVLVPDEGSRIVTLPAFGARTIQLRVQTLDAPTSSANSTTFDFTVEGFQGGTN